jgi:5-hydroxyisourate hydrolase-like protein (transthyretin family)
MPRVSLPIELWTNNITTDKTRFSNIINGMKPALALIVCVTIATVGCGKTSNEKAVYKVLGKIHVDGQPTDQVQIGLHDVAGLDKNSPTYPQGFSQPDGAIRLSTYADGDGAPEGEYKVTFKFQEYNLLSRSFSGPDKLKEKYVDPKTTPFTLKVGSGQTNDLGTVELTTKK